MFCCKLHFAQQPHTMQCYRARWMSKNGFFPHYFTQLDIAGVQYQGSFFFLIMYTFMSVLYTTIVCKILYCSFLLSQLLTMPLRLHRSIVQEAMVNIKYYWAKLFLSKMILATEIPLEIILIKKCYFVTWSIKGQKIGLRLISTRFRHECIRLQVTRGTLKALFVSAGMAMAAPLICSCMILDWSAPVVIDKGENFILPSETIYLQSRKWILYIFISMFLFIALSH